MRTDPTRLGLRFSSPLVGALALAVALATVGPASAEPPGPGPRGLEIDRVWSGHPVGFDWLLHGDLLIVAYYDSDRALTVASRRIAPDPESTDSEPGAGWTKVRLPQKVGWDSHNGIAMVRDAEGLIHLAANMHVAPLVYFRTDRPDDVTSFVAINRMTGDRETRCTYPRFFQGPNRELLFSHRDGASGAGDLLMNVYDPTNRSWRRLIDGPLLDGDGERNAYPFGPSPGPDGRFHIGWVWRDTPDCATNHDLGYARSRDLVHWENAAGDPLTLPIHLDSPATVDPVPVRGGLLNLNNSIAFDSRNRPILAYHKYDAEGNLQAYAARFENGRWKVRQASSWDSRWDFSGGGSIQVDVTLGRLAPDGPGRFALPYTHWIEGEGRIPLDEETLTPIAADAPRPASDAQPRKRERSPTASSRSALLQRLRRPEGADPGLTVHLMTRPGPAGSLLALRWETLGPNRDHPRPGTPPAPSPLRLHVVPASR